MRSVSTKSCDVSALSSKLVCRRSMPRSDNSSTRRTCSTRSIPPVSSLNTPLLAPNALAPSHPKNENLRALYLGIPAKEAWNHSRMVDSTYRDPRRLEYRKNTHDFFWTAQKSRTARRSSFFPHALIGESAPSVPQPSR